MSNQYVTTKAQATLTPAMIESLLKDPTSWLSIREQAALDERLHRLKERIKQDYLLAHGKKMDDLRAEAEAQKLLNKQAEQARIQGLNEYYEEQRQLALKQLGTNGTLPTYFDVLLTKRADLVKAEMLLSIRIEENAHQIKATQADLKDTQAELEVVRHEWTEAKLEAQKTREQIEHKFNNDTIVVEEVDEVTKLATKREVSVSTNVLSEDKNKKITAYRADVIDRLVEAFNKDGSIDMQKYGIIMASAFIDVLAEQRVRSSVRYANVYAVTLLPFVTNLASIAQRLEILNRRREELTQKEARQLAELAEQMRKQKELLREMVKVQEETLQLSRVLAANSPYSGATLITKFGLLVENGQREKQQATYLKDRQQQGTLLEEPVLVATEGAARGRGMRTGG